MNKARIYVKYLILLMVIVNSFGMLFPGLSSTFTPWFGSIAKEMALSNNWVNLTFAGSDWLDKPHLPFWLTAISFKIFGIKSFAYVLPGFLFHLIGAIYTYKLAKKLYDEDTGLLASLIYLSTFHLLVSSIDVRAEAYLLGQIIPACYYWLCYDKNSSIYNLFLGALFTGLALMTKGIFVILTIMSGLGCVWIYKREFKNFISPKWILALLLSFFVALPELLALYLQFDMHPEKIVFGHTNVSGVKFFFIDSQFGRFLSTGPISSTNPPVAHQLYFIHTFLWAFLPWWPLFFIGLWSMLRNFKMKPLQQRENIVFLLGSFFITFILFSLSTLQVDHYTNIIFPFSAIICANWLVCAKELYQDHKAYKLQVYLSYLLIFLILAIGLFILNGQFLFCTLILMLISLILIVIINKKEMWYKVIILPPTAIAIVFIMFECINGLGYIKFDAGYNIAKTINKLPPRDVIDYRSNLLSLEFYSNNKYRRVCDNLDKINRPYYLVVNQDNLQIIDQILPNAKIIGKVGGTSIETFMQNLLNPAKLQTALTQYIIMEVN